MQTGCAVPRACVTAGQSYLHCRQATGGNTMGQLIDGVWHGIWYHTKSTGGRFVRGTAGFRNWITPDGGAGPSGQAVFSADSGRYHLWVSYAGPWAHRTTIFCQPKGLAPHMGISVVHPGMPGDG